LLLTVDEGTSTSQDDKECKSTEALDSLPPPLTEWHL
jgi:hypothetical protein